VSIGCQYHEGEGKGTAGPCARNAPAREDHDRYIVPGLRRGLTILQLFNRSPGTM